MNYLKFTCSCGCNFAVDQQHIDDEATSCPRCDEITYIERGVPVEVKEVVERVQWI